jgi:hypothetical protein
VVNIFRIKTTKNRKLMFNLRDGENDEEEHTKKRVTYLSTENVKSNSEMPTFPTKVAAARAGVTAHIHYPTPNLLAITQNSNQCWLIGHLQEHTGPFWANAGPRRAGDPMQEHGWPVV